MTGAEALAGTWYLLAVHDALGQGGVYHFPVVLAGAVLALGLTAESVGLASMTDGISLDAITAGAAFAIVEVAIWTQWANIVLTGLWSRTGIGPAAVVLALGLIGVHSLETSYALRESVTPRLFVTAAVEAMAVTAAWVVLTSGYPLLAGVALFGGIGIEHGYRLTDAPRAPLVDTGAEVIIDE